MSVSLAGSSLAVLSPHLDDAVFSVGAGISRHTRRDGRVRVVTVFGGDPESDAPASEWDRRPGWTSEGEATRARRAEDLAATRLLGAEARWLPFADDQYAQPRNADAIFEAVDAATEGFDVVLVPGAPLSHPDHRFVAELVLARGLPGRALWLYAEQPYRYWHRQEHLQPPVPPYLKPLIAADPYWTTLEASQVDFIRKWFASRSYASQLPLLKLRRRRKLRLARFIGERMVHGGEEVLVPREEGDSPGLAKPSEARGGPAC